MRLVHANLLRYRDRLRHGDRRGLDHLSPQFRDLLSWMLHIDPEQRPTAEELTCSPMLLNYSEDGQTTSLLAEVCPRFLELFSLTYTHTSMCEYGDKFFFAIG